MAFRWLAIVILILALAIFYLATINPAPVEVSLPFLGKFRPTSGLLMILSFGIGILAALVFFAIRDWQDYFRKLALRKNDKLLQAAREKLLRSRNYLQLGLDDLALAYLRESLSKSSVLPEAHDLMGDLAAGKGDYYAAAASHSHALNLDRSNEAVTWKLAKDYQGAGNTAMALKVFREALEAGEKNVYLWVRYRDFLVELRDWEGAINAQARLSKIKEYRHHEDHRHFLAGLHLEKGLVLLGQERHEEATKSFEEAAKLDPKLSPAYVRHGDAQIAQGKDKAALKIWALGYRRTADQAILSRLEEYYLQHQDPSRIINIYLRHIDEKPQDAMLRFHFAELLFNLEMLQEAQNQIEEVRRLLREDNPQVVYLSYRLRKKMEDTQGAQNEMTFLVEKCFAGNREWTCAACEKKWPDFTDRCPACGRWGSLRKNF